jgi:hypothetical protein
MPGISQVAGLGDPLHTSYPIVRPSSVEFISGYDPTRVA